MRITITKVENGAVHYQAESEDGVYHVTGSVGMLTPAGEQFMHIIKSAADRLGRLKGQDELRKLVRD